eukprot:gb/GECG01007695.1/.p1 GENE.gb/GECG01007695.1/~~gb/GECG01007695.1/.p1  ORF type:complete len:187 (+),score=17.94 gb/GECG01007695.1/:1-561(+)
MVRYSKDPSDEAKAAKTRGSYLNVHFKKAREVGHALKNMNLPKAKHYLNEVLEHKRGVPMRKFTGGCGRSAVGKQEKHAPGNAVAFPTKAVKFFLDLIRNAEANAEVKNLDTEKLRISHVQVNAAPKTRRRTYRAHGRIGPYLGHPCHIELILSEPHAVVPKPEPSPRPISRKLAAKKRVAVGGGH